MDSNLNISKRRKMMIFCISSVVSRLREVILFRYSALERPHARSSCVPQYNKHMDLLEQIQCSATKKIKGLEHLSYAKRLTELGLFSLQKATCFSRGG